MISAVWLKSATKTLYFVQYDKQFSLDAYKNFSAFSETSINYYNDIVVSKKIGELQLFLFGNKNANELLIERGLETIDKSLFQVLDGLVTEENVITNYLNVATTISEIVDNGVVLTEEQPELFTKQAESGIVHSVLGGVKFLAKTILQ